MPAFFAALPDGKSRRSEDDLPEGKVSVVPQETAASQTEFEPASAVRCRWFPISLISLPLIIINSAWIANSEMRSGVTELTISTLFIGVTFMLVALTVLNLAVRSLFGRRVALNQPEMMAIYSILSMSSVVAGVGNMGFFVPFLASAHWYAAPTNGYKSFWYLLPQYLIPHDRAILKPLAEGHSTFFKPEIMAAWMPPLLAWGAFFLVLLWMNFCTASILRKRWAEEEHLPFPVVALPLEITREGSPIFRNRLFWIGVSIPAVLHSMNTIASIMPGFPSWPINSIRDIAANLPVPWNGLSPMWGAVHPAGVGFGFLVNTDVLFSVWFFYLLRKCLNIIGVFTGWRIPSGGLYDDGNSQFPYTGYQSWGAWVAFAVIMLWQNRAYLRRYFSRAFTGKNAEEDAQEPISARAAVIGLVAGFIALSAFIIQLGGSWWLPPLILGIYLLFMITLSRLQAETAVLSPDVGWVYPLGMVTNVVGTANLSAVDSAHVGLMSWFNLDYRAAALPHQLQSMVGQQRSGGSMRPLAPMLMIAAFVAMVSAMICDLQLYYVNGMETGMVNGWRVYMGNHVWQNVDTWIHHPKVAEPACLAGMTVGAVVTGLLTALRSTYAGFPLSPAGFVLSTSWANDIFWADMMIAWAIKTTLLRYGGIKSFRNALPLFLGLILGDFVTGAAWAIVGSVGNLDLFRTFAT